MQRDIKFQPANGRLLHLGLKTCTSRSKKLADPGGTFEYYGATFEISDVCLFSLEYVRRFLFYAEGAVSPEHFEAIYRSVSRNRPFNPDKLVYIHFFNKWKLSTSHVCKNNKVIFFLLNFF